MCSVPCFFSHDKFEVRRKPFNDGKILYLNEICQNIINFNEWENGVSCKYCHSELEFLYHPVEYRTNIWQKASHPFSDFCPHAHTAEEIREVSGYFKYLEIPSQEKKEEHKETEKEKRNTKR